MSAAVELVVVTESVFFVEPVDVVTRSVRVRRRSTPEAGALLKVVPGAARPRWAVVAATVRKVAGLKRVARGRVLRQRVVGVTFAVDEILAR